MRIRILEAAEELYVSKGFDAVTTNDILEKAQITRGTLYNHFRSKERIFEGVCRFMTERMMRKAKEIVKYKDAPVLYRLMGVAMVLCTDGKKGVDGMARIYKTKNAWLYQKVQYILLRELAPILKELMEEAISKDVVHTEYGMEAIGMIMMYANAMFEDIDEKETGGQELERLRQKRLQGFIFQSEKLLGTERDLMQKTVMRLIENNGGPLK